MVEIKNLKNVLEKCKLTKIIYVSSAKASFIGLEYKNNFV